MDVDKVHFSQTTHTLTGTGERQAPDTLNVKVPDTQLTAPGRPKMTARGTLIAGDSTGSMEAIRGDKTQMDSFAHNIKNAQP